MAEVASDQPENFQRYKCVEAAAAMKAKLESEGIKGKHVRLETDYGMIGSDTHGKLASNGVHEFIEVDGMIFDNMNPQGVPKQQYMQDLVISSPPTFTVTDF